MNRKNLLLAASIIVFAAFMMGCNTTENKLAEAAPPDMEKLKADIQALENGFAAADNARDAKAVAAFYAEDAISFPSNKPIISGKEAILKDIEGEMAKKPNGATISFEVLDVFGDENTVTEMGKSVVKDSAGAVMSSGKYMAVWKKREGKYVCIRDIYNSDAPE